MKFKKVFLFAVIVLVSFLGAISKTDAVSTWPDLTIVPFSITNTPNVGNVTISANIKNQGQEAVVGNFNNYILIAVVTGTDISSPPFSGANCSTPGYVGDMCSHYLGYIGPVSITNIGAGETKNITFNHVFSDAVDWRISVCTDRGPGDPTNQGIIAETNENNNCSPWTQLVVGSPIKPDLVVKITPYFTPSTARVGHQTSFGPIITSERVDYRPSATTATNFQNLFQMYKGNSEPDENNSSIENTMSIMPSLLYLQGLPATFTYTFSSPGKYWWRTCADRSSYLDTGIIPEVSESNNCMSWREINVNPDIDLISEATNIGVTLNYLGQEQTIISSVKNQGLSPTGGGFNGFFQISDAIVGEPGGTIENVPSIQIQALGPGEEREISVSRVFAPGGYSFRSCVDQSSPTNTVGVIEETNENNNCSPWRNFIVNAPIIQLPNLVAGKIVSSLNGQNWPYNTDPVTAVAGVEKTFYSAINNYSGSPTGGSFSNFFQVADGDPWNSGTIIHDLPASLMPELTTFGLPATQAYTFSFPGTYYMRVCADKSNSNDQGLIMESNETDNCGVWTEITVSGSLSNLPDLTAEMDDNLPPGTFGSLSATQYESTSFSAKVSNIGESSTGGSFNNLFQVAASNGANPSSPDMSNIKNFPVLGMGAISQGGSSVVTSSFIVFDDNFAGSFIRLCADKNSPSDTGLINESNENNNCSPWIRISLTQNLPFVRLEIAPASNILGSPHQTETGLVGVINPTLVWKNSTPDVYSPFNIYTPISCVASGDWSGSKSPITNKFETKSENIGILNIVKTYTYTLTCSFLSSYNGLTYNAQSTATVVVTSSGLSGTLSATDCQISANESDCISNITWSTTNPVSGKISAVTTPTNITVGTGNNGSTTYHVAYGYRDFFLYHNGVELAQKRATASCITGTVWNTTDLKCRPITVSVIANPPTVQSGGFSNIVWTSTNATACTLTGGGLSETGISGSVNSGSITATTTYTANCTGLNGTSGSAAAIVTVNDTGTFGTLSASDCEIPAGGTSCPSSLSWKVTNPIPSAQTAITTNPEGTVPGTNITQGNTTFSIKGPVSKTFYLYHNSVELANKIAIARCASGTSWNGSVCFDENGGANLPDLIATDVNPVSAVPLYVPLKFSATIVNQSNKPTGKGFTNIFQIADNTEGLNATVFSTADAPSLGGRANTRITARDSYTFTTNQDKYIRVCADKSSASSVGTITESNENNNCSSPWVHVIPADTSIDGVCSDSGLGCKTGNLENITDDGTNYHWQCVGWGEGAKTAECSGLKSEIDGKKLKPVFREI